MEAKTAAIYHAARTQLLRVDRIQNLFLENAGMTELDALVNFRLASLRSRRDMALLGLIHRTVLGLGPNQFQRFFRLDENRRNPEGRESERRHSLQLITHRTGKYLKLLGDSILGLVDVYNLLPAYVVAAGDVSNFQKRLQGNMVDAARRGLLNWQELYSPRLAMYMHPLRKRMPARNTNVVGTTPGTARVSGTNRCVNGWLRFAQ